MKRQYIILAALALLCSHGSAAEYHVHPTQGSDRKAGTAEKPWRSVRHALPRLKAGDTLRLHAGTYPPLAIVPSNWNTDGRRPGTAYADIAGAPGKPITIARAGKDKVVITGRENNGFLILQRDHFVIDGLEIHGVRNNCMNIQGNWVIIRNCVLHDSGTAIKANNRAGNHHLLIERCSIYNFGGIALFPDAYDQVIIRHNVLFNTGSVAMDPGGTHDMVIENNFVANPRKRLGALKIRWGNVEHVNEPNCNGAIVRNNIFLEGGRYNLLLASANGVMVYNNTMLNNSLKGPMESGIVFMQRDPADIDPGKPMGPNKRNVLKNNIFYLNGGDATPQRWVHNTIICIARTMSADLRDQEIDYNLYYKSRGRKYVFAIRQTMTNRNLKGWAGKYDKNSLIGKNPKLIAKTAGGGPDDYRLKSDSPCIDAGTPLTKTVRSGRGRTLRVVDARYFTSGHGLIPGDRIRIGDQPLVRVTGRNTKANTLTLESDVTWNKGDPVTLEYGGEAPDIGAYEDGLTIKIGDAEAADRVLRLFARAMGR